MQWVEWGDLEEVLPCVPRNQKSLLPKHRHVRAREKKQQPLQPGLWQVLESSPGAQYSNSSSAGSRWYDVASYRRISALSYTPSLQAPWTATVFSPAKCFTRISLPPPFPGLLSFDVVLSCFVQSLFSQYKATVFPSSWLSQEYSSSC